MGPGCHLDFLIVLYEKEVGLPPTMKEDGAFNSFCNGWNMLDQEFSFGDLTHTPHARRELRY